MTAFDKPVPKSLDAITDLVLAFRSLPKSESAKKRVEKAGTKDSQPSEAKEFENDK